MRNTRLDKRHAGYKDFKYCVDFLTNELNNFMQIRNWSWEQLGPSCELDLWYKIHTRNPSWCWKSDKWRNRIYFASDAEYQWYLLKWC